MRHILGIVAFLTACGLAAPLAQAQRVTPFISPAATGFDPEISVLNVGQIMDAQATVSHDRKYVTITSRASSSHLLALRQFDFQTASNRQALGFVGGAGAGAAVAVNNNTRVAVPSGAANPLDQPGMTLVARLDD